MQNSLEDFLILHELGINGKPPNGPSILPVSWKPPPQGWIKVNIDSVEKGAPGQPGCGGIFHTSHGFVKRCFFVYLGIKFASKPNSWDLFGLLKSSTSFSGLIFWLNLTLHMLSIWWNPNLIMCLGLSRPNGWMPFMLTLWLLRSHTFIVKVIAADKLASNTTSSGMNSSHFNALDYINSMLYRDMVPLPHYRFRNLAWIMHSFSFGRIFYWILSI